MRIKEFLLKSAPTCARGSRAAARNARNHPRAACFHRIAALLLLSVASSTAGAQQGRTPVNDNTIAGTALQNASGVISVNSIAGVGNAQSNDTAIGIGAGITDVGLLGRQRVAPAAATGIAPPVAGESVAIRDSAFANARGIVTVNQSSGSGSAQANLVAIGIGAAAEITVDQLADVGASMSMRAPAPSSADGGGARRRAEIADGAFNGASGIVQINQSAGSGNSTANVFALRINTSIP